MKLSQRTSKLRGFTLVELLVVIALIAGLAGISIAVISRVSAGAKSAKVSSNMKQIYNALTVLSGEGVNTGLHPRGSFPPYEGSLQTSNSPDFIWWDLAAEQMDLASQQGGGYRWSVLPADSVFQNPLSKKTLGGPSGDFESLINDPDNSRGSYAYNAALGDDVSQGDNQENVTIVREHQIQDAGATIYFAESDDEGDTEGWIFDGTDDAPQGNYKESAHCMFVDGNVQLLPNENLKEASVLDFYTTVKDKNYSSKP